MIIHRIPGLLIGNLFLSFQLFSETELLDEFRVDVTEGKISHLEEVSVRILSRCPLDLLGFGVNQFYAFAMVRHACVDWGQI